MMTIQATRYNVADLTDMLIPRHIPAKSKIVVKLSVTNPTMEVISLLIRNNWSDGPNNNWAIWCVTPAEIDAAREGLQPYFGKPNANGIATAA